MEYLSETLKCLKCWKVSEGSVIMVNRNPGEDVYHKESRVAQVSYGLKYTTSGKLLTGRISWFGDKIGVK